MCEEIAHVINEVVGECVHCAYGIPHLIIEIRVPKTKWKDSPLGQPETTYKFSRVYKRHDSDLACQPATVQIVATIP